MPADDALGWGRLSNLEVTGDRRRRVSWRAGAAAVAPVLALDDAPLGLSNLRTRIFCFRSSLEDTATAATSGSTSSLLYFWHPLATHVTLLFVGWVGGEAAGLGRAFIKTPSTLRDFFILVGIAAETNGVKSQQQKYRRNLKMSCGSAGNHKYILIISGSPAAGSLLVHHTKIP